MSKTTVFIVSDNSDAIEKGREFWEEHGYEVQVYSSSQWNQGLESSSFRSQVRTGVPQLSAGSSPLSEGAKVLPFPSQTFESSSSSSANGKVPTMNELECQAIESAIMQFKGNLTEAAKALGIGRATLYRKVKQYNIDPSMARRRRVA